MGLERPNARVSLFAVADPALCRPHFRTVARSHRHSQRQRQLRRFNGEKIFANAAMTPRMIRTHCSIDSTSERMLESAMTRLGLSTRAYDRILKVSRTIADLEDSDTISSTHVSEAVGYRSLDRTYWT